MRTIAVANQKGGCGKTTTSVNLSVALALVGKKVLVVDMDSQAHATMALGTCPDELDNTIYDVLTDPQVALSNSLLHTNIEGLDLIPSNVLLSGAESHLIGLHGREYVLQNRLGHLNGDYDVCIIDCSPSLNILTLNALVASVEVIIPVQTQYYALEGLKQLLETIDIIKARFNSSLNILGILLTFVESRTLLSRDIQCQTKEFFGNLVFDTVIHRNVRLAEAPSAGESVLTYDSQSRGALEYMTLAKEIINETQSRTTKENFVNF